MESIECCRECGVSSEAEFVNQWTGMCIRCMNEDYENYGDMKL